MELSFSKKLIVNLGNYQSAHFEFGSRLDSESVMEFETIDDAANFLRSNVNRYLEMDIKEFDPNIARALFKEMKNAAKQGEVEISKGGNIKGPRR